MTSAESAKLAKVAQDLVQWIQNQALDGIGPLPSASDLADDYKRQSYANDAARVQGLIKWAVAKNAAAGFVAGLGGLLTLPVTIPGSSAASLAIRGGVSGAEAAWEITSAIDDAVKVPAPAPNSFTWTSQWVDSPSKQSMSS